MPKLIADNPERQKHFTEELVLAVLRELPEMQQYEDSLIVIISDLVWIKMQHSGLRLYPLTSEQHRMIRHVETQEWDQDRVEMLDSPPMKNLRLAEWQMEQFEEIQRQITTTRSIVQHLQNPAIIKTKLTQISAVIDSDRLFLVIANCFKGMWPYEVYLGLEEDRHYRDILEGYYQTPPFSADGPP